MNLPNPALVTQRAAQRLPRLALLTFCAAYLLPGLFGRDPWRNADITAFGFMLSIANGASSWLSPTIAGVPSSGAVLPYWLGALFVKLLAPLADPALAARIPFAILLGLTFALTWYTTYHLARTDAAKPLPFAFGGEASDIDYARAVADGALLALIATLGLLQLGHETTPELVQLAAVALFLFGLSSFADSPLRSRIAIVLALPMLAASGAPSIAAGMSVVAALAVRPYRAPAVATTSSFGATTPPEPADPWRLSLWVLASGVLAVATASVLGVWNWRLSHPNSSGQWFALIRLLLWFSWPTWPLAIYTLWRWRRQLRSAHIAVPASIALVAIVSSIAMAGSDRALMLAAPALAVLAAFALPTLKRSASAAIDWFSVFFFTICAGFIWVIYMAMQTGVPAKPAANVAKLAIGFQPSFSLVALVFASLGTLAWLWLVRWRVGRNRHPLWKSMVLPASGVALCWLLLMTLGLPVLDYARSYRPMIRNIARHAPEGSCTWVVNLPVAQLAALEYFGRYQVRLASLELLGNASLAASGTPACDYLMLQDSEVVRAVVPHGWTALGREQRPTERSDITVIYKRSTVGG
jgi:4-amino-4-deoxy-L-arabinose transferase-like glycosyltransferase